MRPMLLALLLTALLSAGLTQADAQDAAVYDATYVEVAPGAIPQGVALVKAFAAAGRKEDGNLGFHIVQEHDRPNRFAALGTWKDQASFEAHRKGKAYAEFGEKLMLIGIAPPDERVHNGLAPAPGGLPASSRGSVWVVTHVDVPPTSKDACIAELKTLAEASRKEAGNLAFGVVQQSSRANHFTVVEVWQDQKAYDSHAIAEHTKKFRTNLGPMVGAPYDDRVYTAVE